MFNYLLDHPIQLFLLLIVITFGPVVVYEYYDSTEMQRLHCKPTGASKLETVLMPSTIIVNNIPITTYYSTVVTYNEFTCDDGIRWR